MLQRRLLMMQVARDAVPERRCIAVDGVIIRFVVSVRKLTKKTRVPTIAVINVVVSAIVLDLNFVLDRCPLPLSIGKLSDGAGDSGERSVQQRRRLSGEIDGKIRPRELIHWKVDLTTVKT